MRAPSGATPRFVRLRPPVTSDGDWTFDPDELRAAFSSRTRAIVINTPNNPTGKVFTRNELELVASLCREWMVIAVMNEIYEHIVYDGAVHVPLATLDGMAERTVSINSVSKTFSVTGWRVGWAVAPADITSAIRRVHDFLTVGAAAPLQAASAAALGAPAGYYADLASTYAGRRQRLLGILAGRVPVFRAAGADHVMTDVSAFGFPDDVSFVRHLVSEFGVAAVPGSSFFSAREHGRSHVRFCFCKREEQTRAAAEARLARLRSA